MGLADAVWADSLVAAELCVDAPGWSGLLAPGCDAGRCCPPNIAPGCDAGRCCPPNVAPGCEADRCSPPNRRSGLAGGGVVVPGISAIGAKDRCFVAVTGPAVRVLACVVGPDVDAGPGSGVSPCAVRDPVLVCDPVWVHAAFPGPETLGVRTAVPVPAAAPDSRPVPVAVPVPGRAVGWCAAAVPSGVTDPGAAAEPGAATRPGIVTVSGGVTVRGAVVRG